MLDNIEFVVDEGLCVGCGTCAGVCPVDALEMRVLNGLFLPVVDWDKCTRCGLCVRCCPGYAVDFEDLNHLVFGKQPEDKLTGNFLSCHVGHSNDEEIRFNSASGGVVSQLLVFALEKGLIDGVVVTRMRVDDPLVSESFIARSKEEIVSACGSKYCPTCVNEILQQVRREDGKFAVVGLPCQIHGVRKAEVQIEALRDKIVLHVGLMCSHTVSYYGTLFLLSKFGIDKREVAKLDYRGRGWPGSLRVVLKDGRSLSFRFVKGWNAYWNVFSPFFFTPLRCLMCPDHFNELADVSVGDAWLPEFRDKRLGEAVVVSRTGIGESLLTQMRDEGILSVRHVSPSRVKESQAFSLKFKKENLSSRLSFFGIFGKKTPVFNPEPCSSGFMGFLGAFLAYFSFYVSSNTRLRSLLVYVPLPLFRLYFGLFKVLFYLT